MAAGVWSIISSDAVGRPVACDNRSGLVLSISLPSKMDISLEGGRWYGVL